MVKTTRSGKIFLERKDNQYSISKFNEPSYELLITTTAEYFGYLQFIAMCLGYDACRISRGGTLNTNFVRISRTVEDMYEIGIALESIALSKTDALDLMKCIEISSGWDNDKIASKYGLKKDDRPTVKTIRKGDSFPGYSPNIIKGHFSLSVEEDGHVSIYYLTKWGDWVDAFMFDSVGMINRFRQVLILVKDCMIYEEPIQIVSPFGGFNYNPEYSSSAEFVIGGEQKILDKDDISDLICVICVA